MSEIGQITVKIGADTYELQKGLGQAQTQVAGFQKNTEALTGTLKTLALAGVATATALGTFVKTTIDAMDALDDVSQKTGVATEALSKLGYVANIEGIGVQGLQQAFVFLSRNMSEAAQGAGSALPAFNALGIQFKNVDGTLRSADDVFLDVSERFARMEDGAQKTAIAMAIFGRAGAQLIPMLNYGRDSLQAYGDELDAFGGTISKDMAQAAAQFNDNMVRVTTALKSVGVGIANEMLPALTRLSEEFIIARKNGVGFFDMLQMGVRFGNYKEQLAQLEQQLENVNKAWAFPIGPSREERIASLNRQRDALIELIKRQDELNAKENMMGPPSDLKRKEQAPTILSEEERKKREEEEKKRLEAEQQRKADAAKRLEELLQGMMTERQLEQEKFRQQQEDLLLAKEALGITEEDYRMWLEQLENEHWERMNAIRKKGLTDAQKFTEMSYKDQAKTVAGQLANMTASVANSSKEMFAINKAASLVNAVISTYEGINKTLSAYPYPLSVAMAAAQAAAGFANVRAIASQQFSGRGTTAPSVAMSTPAGATPVAPVGGGGMASGGGIGGGGQTVNINLVGNTFNREQVRDLITQINEVVSDGSTLRLQ